MQPKATVRGLPVYQPGKPLEEVKRELGLEEVIKLASNENPFGCSPKVWPALGSKDAFTFIPRAWLRNCGRSWPSIWKRTPAGLSSGMVRMK